MTVNRRINPTAISVPSGSKVEVFARELDAPISLLFTETGDMIISDALFRGGHQMITVGVVSIYLFGGDSAPRGRFSEDGLVIDSL